MSKIRPAANLTVRHIWEAYAERLLSEHPDWWGRTHNKIRNFYLYRAAERGEQHYNNHVVVLSYTLFRRVLETFLTEARKRIIYRGEAVHLPRCGRILAKRVERKHQAEDKKKQKDWGATRQQPLVWDEKLDRFRYERVVYFTDDDWCRIDWFKTEMVNGSFYTFEPTNERSSLQDTPGSITGFKQEFTAALKANRLLKFRYLYEPLTPRATRHSSTTTIPQDHGIPSNQP